MKIPAKCTNPNCGLEFKTSNQISVKGSHNLVSNFSTNCPSCNFPAKVLDFATDSEGKVIFKHLFDHAKTIKNTETLKILKSELENLNKNATTSDIVDILVETDSGFSKFKGFIGSLPQIKATVIKNLFITFLSIYIPYLAYKAQLEGIQLEKDKFEYQKKQDQKEQVSIAETEKKIEGLNDKIINFEKVIEQQLNEHQSELESNKNRLNKVEKEISTPKIKGLAQYKKCECGSGKRVNICHPYGYDRH